LKWKASGESDVGRPEKTGNGDQALDIMSKLDINEAVLSNEIR
jgi:hypothetical protein